LIASQTDKLVPYDAAIPAALPENVTALSPACGHIGMMAGRNAKIQVWQSYQDWLIT
jgi:hypothetical protein